MSNLNVTSVSGLAGSPVSFPDGFVAAPGQPSFLYEASSQAAEDSAWDAGAQVVLRTDLIYLDNESLLMHFDGANNGTTFTDTSENNRAFTRVGTPVTSTTTSKFGSACLDFSGAGNYLTTPDSPNLRLGSNWTIELWHKFKTNHFATTSCFLACKGLPGTGYLNQAWYCGLNTAAGAAKLTFCPANNTTAIYVNYPYSTDTTNWHHISFNCIANVLTAYVDGVVIATATLGAGAVPALYEGTGPLYVGGWNYGTANTEGDYMDELIITSGAAIRTGPFTPPNAPF
jgi:hypothetical protein